MFTSLDIFFCAAVFISVCSAYQVKNVTGPGTDMGESPVWHAQSRTLFLVDLTGQAALRYYPDSGVLKRIPFKGTVSPLIPVSGNESQLLVGVGLSLQLATVRWGADNEEPQLLDCKTLAVVDQDKACNRFNDGKADSRGRVWIGTMHIGYQDGDGKSGRGSLYRFTPHDNSAPGAERLQVSLQDANLDIPNGLGWTSDDKVMYHVDTNKNAIYSFNFSCERGTVGGKRLVFDFSRNAVPGQPDGMTLDSDGNLWIASVGGGLVIQVDPRTGSLLQRVEIPTKKVTAVEWGGDDLSTLYVTTAVYGLSDAERTRQPLAGALFAVTGLNARGVPEGTHFATV